MPKNMTREEAEGLSEVWAGRGPQCTSTCPHGDQCRLVEGHDDGHSHRWCDCNEPNTDRPDLDQDGVFRYILRELRADHPHIAEGRFEACTPYRQIFYQGATPEEAIGRMLADCCRLGRDGSLDPANPRKQGKAAVQHAMEVLEERLKWHLAERAGLARNACEDFWAAPMDQVDPAPRADPGWEEVVKCSPQFARHAEIVSGLATAIAALARIKEL